MAFTSPPEKKKTTSEKEEEEKAFYIKIILIKYKTSDIISIQR